MSSLRDRIFDCEGPGSALQIHAEEAPDDLAFRFYNHAGEAVDERTFASLLERAAGVARKLQSMNVARQSPVLLIFDQSLEFVDALMGCILAGCIPAPCSPPRGARLMLRLEKVTEDCQPTAILTSASILNRTPGLSELAAVLDVQACPAGEGPFLQSASDHALLQYTSGSTGNPKGVIVSNHALRSNFIGWTSRWRYQFRGEDEPTTLACWLPQFHDMGLIGNVIDAIMLGTTCHMLSPSTFIQYPKAWLKVISDQQVRAAGSPDFGYRLCAQIGPEVEIGSLESLRVLWNGAEPIRPAVTRQFAERFASAGLSQSALTPCYGLAEATLMVSGRPFAEGAATLRLARPEFESGVVALAEDVDLEALELMNCGSALDGHEIAIVDPDSLDVLPSFTIGEIWFAGPSVASGYWNRPEESEAVFRAFTADQRGPFLRTGDLGFLDDDGGLFITGRQKDLIIVRGANHLPQDIEATVERASDAVQTDGVAAFSMQSEDGEGVAIVAELRRTMMRKIAPEEVARKIRAKVSSDHGVSVSFTALLRPSGLLKTSSGKVMRQAHRQALAAGSLPVIYQEGSFARIRT